MLILWSLRHVAKRWRRAGEREVRKRTEGNKWTKKRCFFLSFLTPRCAHFPRRKLSDLLPFTFSHPLPNLSQYSQSHPLCSATAPYMSDLITCAFGCWYVIIKYNTVTEKLRRGWTCARSGASLSVCRGEGKFRSFRFKNILFVCSTFWQLLTLFKRKQDHPHIDWHTTTHVLCVCAGVMWEQMIWWWWWWWLVWVITDVIPVIWKSFLMNIAQGNDYNDNESSDNYTANDNCMSALSHYLFLNTSLFFSAKIYVEAKKVRGRKEESIKCQHSSFCMHQQRSMLL